MSKKSLIKMVFISFITMTCSGCATLELLAASGLSYLVTGKSLTDNALSIALDEDCAMHRIVLDRQICDQRLVDPDMVTEDDELLIASTKSPSAATSEDSPGTVEVSIARSDLTENQEQKSNQITDNDVRMEAQIYAVVGSFNNFAFAQNRMKKYSRFQSRIIESGDTNVAYRVIVGPFEHADEIRSLPTRVGIETSDPWAITLCDDGITVDTCGAGLLAKR